MLTGNQAQHMGQHTGVEAGRTSFLMSGQEKPNPHRLYTNTPETIVRWHQEWPQTTESKQRIEHPPKNR